MLVPTHSDRAGRAEERARRATGVYERHAYLVYNLALRIACEREPAQRAAERTFLQLADAAHVDADVVRVAVRAALAQASERPQPGTVADAEAARLLEATSTMLSAQRAALALEALCGLDARGVAAVLDLGTDGAATLLEASRAALAVRLGSNVEEASAAYGAWLWSAPPDGLWPSVWSQLHAVPPEETPPPEQSSPSPSPVPRRARRRRPRLRRPRLRTLVMLALLSTGAAAYAAGVADDAMRSSPSEPDATPAAAPPAAAAPAADPPDRGAAAEAIGPNPDAGAPERKARPLSPAELDKLRLGELRALRTRYERRREDRSLPAGARADARRQVARIQRAAQRRIRAAQARERAARRELARERAERARERAARERRAAQRRARDAEPEPAPAPRERPAKSPTPATPPEDGRESGCLYNPDDGSYICPVE